ncbi:MAG TPA: hypothetical protein VMT53_05665 [Terriglobales bacterium]|nr:hypothetical protein [Terriglobales bacterium]
MTYANEFAASAKNTAGANRSRLVGTALLLTLLLSIGCSQEKSKPAVGTSSVSTAPAQTIAPPSPVLSAAQPATSKPVVKKAVKKHASMVTYKDDNYGISFGYPRKYSLKTGEDLKSGAEPVAMNFTQPGGITAVSVELPNNAYPGTDLTSAFFQVNALKGLGEAECGQFAVPPSKADDKNAVQPSDVELGGMNFREVENISGESIKQVDTKYYHLFENGTCYEFALGLSTAWDGNEDGVNLVDREDVFRRLEKILVGVKIAPEVTPALPAVAATESTAKPAAIAAGETSAAPATQSASAPQPETVK